MLRTITRGATDAGRGIQRGVRVIGRGIVAFGRVSLDLLRTIVRSYNRGVFLAYIQSGGNVAVTLSTNIVTPYSFHVIELWAHRTVSFAWLWGVLGAIVANSYRSFIDASSSIVNVVLTEEQQFRQTIRNRHLFFRVGLGAPGAVLGLMVGVVGLLGGIIYGTCVNSWISLFSISKRMTNLAMERKWAIDPDRRSLTFFVLGLPGTALGIVIGLVGFLGAGIGRAALNSWISLQRVSRQVTNLALENKMNIGPDNRSLVSKILGSPGIVVGGMFGAVGFVAVGIRRVIYNSLISMTRVFIQVTDRAFEKRTPLDTDDRPIVSIVLGAPGIVVGVVIGCVGFLGVGIGRVVSNSWISLVQQAQRLTNVALEEGHQITSLEVQRSRASTRLGWPGLVLGIVIGSIGFLGAGIGRVAANSWISFVQQAQRLTNVALEEGHQITSLEVQRSRASTRLGWPGLVLGFVIGSIGFLGAGIGRIASNSWVSLVLESQRVMNLAREHQMDADSDPRSLLSIRLGALGVVVGAVIGGVGFLGVGIARVASNSWISLDRITRQVTNVALENKMIIGTDNRPLVSIILGSPGIIVGGILGAVGLVAAGIGRVIYNSLISMTRVIIQVTDIAFENKTTIIADQRPLVSLVLGSPGIFIGFWIGCAGFVGVAIGRVVYNSAITYRDLSGSMMNVVLERAYFEGVGRENTAFKRWGLGLPGAVLSIISVGLPAGMTYLLLRKLIPLMFAIVAFPGVCLYRAVSELGKYFSGNQRFSDTGNVTEQIFKNFFASLTMMGNLPEGERLNRAGNGPFYTSGLFKNITKFLRKGLTFNQQTTTEKLLSLALTEFRVLHTRTTTDSGEDSELAIKAIRISAERLNADCEEDARWIISDAEKNEIKQEISRVSQFLMRYFSRFAPVGDPSAPDRAFGGGVAAVYDDPRVPIEDPVIPALYSMSNEGPRVIRLFFDGSQRSGSVQPAASAPPALPMQAQPSAPSYDDGVDIDDPSSFSPPRRRGWAN